MLADNLIKISFFKSNIGPVGCMALTKANWKKIKKIDLSK
jgi:hypothetical protein